MTPFTKGIDKITVQFSTWADEGVPREILNPLAAWMTRMLPLYTKEASLKRIFIRYPEFMTAIRKKFNELRAGKFDENDFAILNAGDVDGTPDKTTKKMPKMQGIIVPDGVRGNKALSMP